MFVTRQDILTLKKLSSTTDLTPVDVIPFAFKQDFQLFFFGKTLLKKDKAVYAYPHDVKRWTLFMFNKYK
jgi:hypothetical protein